MKNPLFVILGATATGKTQIATQLAHSIDGEIISADSRQVFREMDIGTGKDLDEYTIDGKKIPHHLIDIKNPGEEYSLFEFMQNFNESFLKIQSNKKQAVLCGGTSLYLDALLSRYDLIDVPQSYELDSSYLEKSEEELIKDLKKHKALHNTTDTDSKERLLKALRIEEYKKAFPKEVLKITPFTPETYGISMPMDEIRSKITKRLKYRLKNGMIQEAEKLIDLGVSPDRLKFYGLEYKYLALYLEKRINKNDLFQQLNSAIHAFAKKQMTKYRSMEKNGIKINWIDGKLPIEDKLSFIKENSKILN